RFLRDRVVGDVLGFGIGVSAGAVVHAAGTGTGYLVNGTPAVGASAVPVDGGTGTILAGDVFTVAGDTNKYVSSGLFGTDLGVNFPGLRAAPADNAAITLGAAYKPNIAFTPNAMVLAA